MSFFEFSAVLLIDITWAIGLGVVLNKLVDIVAEKLSLGKISKILLQVVLIVITLYSVQVVAYKFGDFSLGTHWRNDFGLAFVPFFFASQRNIDTWIDDLAFEKKI